MTEQADIQFPDLYGHVMRRSELEVAAHYLHSPGKRIDSSALKPEHFVLVPGLAEHWQRAAELEAEDKPCDISSLLDARDNTSLRLVNEVTKHAVHRATKHGVEIHERRLIEAATLRMAMMDFAAIAESIRGQKATVEQASERGSRVVEAMREGSWGVEVPSVTEVSQGLAKGLIAQIRDGRTIGLPMPLQAMQSNLDGWRPGRSHLICGVTSGHKTTLLRMSAWHMAKQGIPVDYITYEDDAEDIAARCLSSDPNCPFTVREILNGKIARNEAGTFVRCVQALEHKDYPLGIWDQQMELSRLIAFMYQRVQRHNVKAFCIDYLQIIPYDDARAAEVVRLERTAERLRACAKELGVALLIACQPTQEATQRAERDNRVIGKSDVKGASGIAQAAFGLLAMHFPLIERTEMEEVGGRKVPKTTLEREARKIWVVARKWKQAETDRPIVLGLDAAHDRILDNQFAMARGA